MLTYMFSIQSQSNLQATFGELLALPHMFCPENAALCLTSWMTLSKIKFTIHLTCITRKKEMQVFHEIQRGQIYFTLNSAADTKFLKTT